MMVGVADAKNVPNFLAAIDTNLFLLVALQLLVNGRGDEPRGLQSAVEEETPKTGVPGGTSSGGVAFIQAVAVRVIQAKDI
jgi:hypothetical protein